MRTASCKQEESVMRAFMEQTCGLSVCALWYVLKFIMIIFHVNLTILHSFAVAVAF